MKRALVGAIILVLVLVLPVSAAPRGKVTICHMTGTGSVTITVSENALAAHLRHGDSRGACGVPTTTTATVQFLKNTVPADSSKWSFELSNGAYHQYQTWADRLTPFNSGVITIPDPTNIEIDEWAGTGFNIAAYTPSVACTDNGVAFTPPVAQFYSPPVTPQRYYVYFPIHAGHAYVCTFTNTGNAATVRVLKTTVPADSSKWSFGVSNGGYVTYQTWTDQSTPFNSGVVTITDPTNVEIDEWAGTGSSMAAYTPSVTCTDNGVAFTPAASTYTSPHGPTFYALFAIQTGHAYVCTFTNTHKV